MLDVLPQRRPSRYFSSLLLSLFLYLILHLCCALRVREKLSLSLSLWTEKWDSLFGKLELNSFILCLITFIWHFDFIGLWVCRFVYCKFCVLWIFYIFNVLCNVDWLLWLLSIEWRVDGGHLDMGSLGTGVGYLNWGNG